MIYTLIPEENLDCYKRHELVPRYFFFVYPCCVIVNSYLFEPHPLVKAHITYLGVLN